MLEGDKTHLIHVEIRKGNRESWRWWVAPDHKELGTKTQMASNAWPQAISTLKFSISAWYHVLHHKVHFQEQAEPSALSMSAYNLSRPKSRREIQELEREALGWPKGVLGFGGRRNILYFVCVCMDSQTIWLNSMNDSVLFSARDKNLNLIMA